MSDHAATNEYAAGRCTGPRTQDGKNTSRWNSFKHGLYSKQLVIPGEDPAELEALRARLRAEHQPVNTTEEILVNEIAEHFWRLRRMRAYEAVAMRAEEFDEWLERGWLALVARQMASAERGMHKAIATLRRLQLAQRARMRAEVQSCNSAVLGSARLTPHPSCASCSATRGFVPSKNGSNETARLSEPKIQVDEAAFLSEPKIQVDEAAFLSEPKIRAKFVPQNHTHPDFVPQTTSEELDFVPEDFCLDADDAALASPDYVPFSPPSHEKAA